MKLIPLLLTLMILPFTGNANDGKSVHSPFTIEQIAEYLELKGGNWTVEFDDPSFVGFVITKTTKNGKVSHEFFWSPQATRTHEFRFMHHATAGSGMNANHELRFGSEQIEEPQGNSEGDSQGRSSSGTGYTYNVQLPSICEEEVMENDLRLKPGQAALLYSWKSTESEQAFRLDLVSTTSTEETEKALQGE